MFRSICVVILSSLPALLAQARTEDPYALADRSASLAAGYHGFGPFAIGGYHGSADVDALLTPTQVRWIETAHFKIGTTLGEYRVPRDAKQRAKLAAELGRLRARLPGVDPDTDVLDPWLRAHLLAQRCEEVYADFRDRLGMHDADFPTRRATPQLGDQFLGLGPHLGQREKYVVLVFQSARDVARYSREFLGSEFRWPQRHFQGVNRSLLFVTSPELGGQLGDDTAMHVHVVYDVVHLLLDGFRNFGHETPVWFKTGLAQWYGRRIDPRYPNFDRPPSGEPKASSLWEWEPIVARLVRDGRATPLATMATWRDFAAFRFEDYVVAHARVEFLIQRFGDAGLRKFLFRFKDPLTLGRSEPAWELVLAKQLDALHEAYGFADWDALDRAWHESFGRPVVVAPSRKRR